MSRKAATDETLGRRRSALLVPITLLLLLAAGSNVYLTRLYVQVKAAPSPDAVVSFCKLNESVDCVKVAGSHYSALHGIPISLYALEFFVLGLGMIVLSTLKLWKVRAWDSLVFAMLVLALPISLLMAWISIFRIKSLCLLCSVVYGVNALVLLILGVAHRKRLGEFVGEGPRQLARQLSGASLVLTFLVVGLGISQFFWVPGLMTGKAMATTVAVPDDPWHGLPQDKLTVGPREAPVTVEIFTDFECPFCALLHQATHEVVKRHEGKVRLVHRDFPLDQACNRIVTRPFHQDSCAAAIFARCAAEQGKFWHYSSLLYRNQKLLQPSSLTRFAHLIGLDMARLGDCVKSQRPRQAVSQDIEEGIARKINGTPSCFVNGRRVRGRGLIQAEFWEQLIEGILRSKGPQSQPAQSQPATPSRGEASDAGDPADSSAGDRAPREP